MTDKTLHIAGLSKPARLDKVLRDAFPDAGRKAINQLIQERQVQVNNKTVWLNSWKVHNGDTVHIISMPENLPETPQDFDERWLVAVDDDLVVCNKPAGLLSQETQYGNQPNLLSMVRSNFGDVTLFHRLDRDTSGVILLTRSKRINRYLDTAFKARTVKKHYVAVVRAPNKLDAQGIINARIAPQNRKRNRMKIVEKGGKSAITQYIAGESNGTQQTITLIPQTGRTHQLRVHLAHYDAAILGDRIYSRDAEQYPRLFLHAHRITLPADEGFPERTFTAPLPEGF